MQAAQAASNVANSGAGKRSPQPVFFWQRVLALALQLAGTSAFPACQRAQAHQYFAAYNAKLFNHVQVHHMYLSDMKMWQPMAVQSCTCMPMLYCALHNLP